VSEIRFTVHDGCPSPEAELVDAGLSEHNDRAAPLHEVQALSCFARSGDGRLLGGAVGRTWGAFAELQQLWVEPGQRRAGIGTRLVRAFEAHARSKGCQQVTLETFSFQAPQLYLGLGYAVEFVRRGYPHGIAKFHMARAIGQAPQEDPADQARAGRTPAT
jgi:GNAT superfamily N-acetyltransferase